MENTQNIDTTHLSALEVRLSHERNYLAAAKTSGERELRSVWVSQIENEIAAERKLLGITESAEDSDMSDDDLLAALLA